MTLLVIPPGDDFRHAHTVREQVFQTEHKIDRLSDFDGKDDLCFHIVAMEGDTPVGTLRLHIFTSPDIWKLERLAVISTHRGKGIAKALLQKAEEVVRSMGGSQLVMHAQCRAQKLYEKQGYVSQGDEFDEVGTPHMTMYKRL